MATKVANAYVQIIPSAEGITGKLKSELGGASQEAGEHAGKSIANAIKSAIGAAAIGTAIKASIEQGGALEQSIGGVETLFKDSADKVVANASKAFQTAGLSANEYMETVTSFSASLLQGLGGDTAKAAELADTAIVSMSDNANKFGTDMQSIQNAYQGFAKQNYTMLDNLKLGYGGTKTEMERLVKEAAGMTDAMEKLGVSVDADSLSFDNIVTAIAVVQENMGVAGTTASEAAETIQGASNSMKAALQNLIGYISLKDELKPELITSAVQNLMKAAETYIFDNLMPAVTRIVQAIPEIISGAIEMAPGFVTAGVKMVVSLANGLMQGIPKLLTNVPKLIKSMLTALIEGVPQIVTAGVDLVGGLVDGLLQAIPEVIAAVPELVAAAINTLGDNLNLFVQKGTDLIFGLVDGLLNAIPAIIEAVPQLIGTLITSIGNFLPNLIESGIELILCLTQGLIDAIPDLIQAIPVIIESLLTGLIGNLPLIINAGIQLVIGLASGLIKAIPQLVNAVPDLVAAIWDGLYNVDWLSLGRNILYGIKDGLLSVAWSLGNAAKEAAQNALGKVKDFLGIHSPSTVFRDQVGKMMGLGIAEGINDESNAVSAAIKDLSQDTIGTFDSSISVSGSSASANGDNMVSALYAVANIIVNAINSKDTSVVIDGDAIGVAATKYINSQARRYGTAVV